MSGYTTPPGRWEGEVEVPDRTHGELPTAVLVQKSAQAIGIGVPRQLEVPGLPQLFLLELGVRRTGRGDRAQDSAARSCGGQAADRRDPGPRRQRTADHAVGGQLAGGAGARGRQRTRLVRAGQARSLPTCEEDGCSELRRLIAATGSWIPPCRLLCPCATRRSALPPASKPSWYTSTRRRPALEGTKPWWMAW